MNDFQTNAIFDQANANITCDLLVNSLIEAFPNLAPENNNRADVLEHFLLSGRAAALLQEYADVEINNITFQTDNANFMDYIRNNIQSIVECEVFKYADRTTFISRGIYYEVWEADTVDGVLASGIYVQSIRVIPLNLL